MIKNNTLIDELSKLTLEEKNLKRLMNINFYDIKKREQLFRRITIVDKKIEETKIKLRMEKAIKNEK